MTAEAKEVLSYLATLGIGGVIGSLTLFFFLKSYLPSYFQEKAKNLATKEDIAAITGRIESVKNDYAKQLKEFEHQKTLLTEGFKNTLSKEQEFTRGVNAAVVELTKRLAAGSQVMSWLTWNATQRPSLLTQTDFTAYETQMIAVLSDLVGLQASVAALDAKKFGVLSPFAEELYERDIEIAKAKRLTLSKDPLEQQRGNSLLAGIYDRALDFDKRLLAGVTNLLRP